MKTFFMLFAVIFSIAENRATAEGDEIVERFPAGFSDRAAGLRTAVGAELPETEIARIAQEYAQQGRRLGDSQSIRLAMGLLEPLRMRTNLNADGLLTLAGLKSYEHDFSKALTLLDRAALKDGYRDEALLRKISILITVGRFEEARQTLAGNPSLLGKSCGTTLLMLLSSMTGKLEASYSLLARQAQTGRGYSEQEAIWTYGILAEMAERLERVSDAEGFYRKGLEAGTDIYLSNAWLDFLIGQKRLDEAKRFAGASPLRERLLLRKVVAAPTTEEIERVRSGFSGSSAHQRELALFLLAVEVDPAGALQAALANWAVQKEPIDARLVLESAAAAGNPVAAEPVFTWIRNNHFEDVRIAGFLPR